MTIADKKFGKCVVFAKHTVPQPVSDIMMMIMNQKDITVSGVTAQKEAAEDSHGFLFTVIQWLGLGLFEMRETSFSHWPTRFPSLVIDQEIFCLAAADEYARPSSWMN